MAHIQFLSDVHNARSNLRRNVSTARRDRASEFGANVRDARRMSRYCEHVAKRLCAGAESNKRLTLALTYATFALKLNHVADYYDID